MSFEENYNEGIEISTTMPNTIPRKRLLIGFQFFRHHSFRGYLISRIFFFLQSQESRKLARAKIRESKVVASGYR